jgi:peptidoglycan/LPS O-acetylase OafA/YrhL
LQGIDFIVSGVNFSEIAPLGNLWFLTVILLCYILTIAVKKSEEKFKPKIGIVALVLLCICVLSNIVAYFSSVHIVLDYFIIYFIGYYISKFKIKTNKFIFWLAGICLFLLCIIIRLTAKKYLDENYQSLYLIITALSQTLMAVSIYFTFDFLVQKYRLFTTIAQSGLWCSLDKISYYIYITHYAFLNGITSIDRFGLSRLYSILIFAVFTVASALIIYLLNKVIQKKLIKS